MRRDVKEALLDAAAELIGRPGVQPEQVTVREIAAAAGVGAALINYHFGSKEQLVSACVQRMLGEIIADCGSVLSRQEGTPRERLYRLACSTGAYLARRPNLARVSILDDLSRAGFTEDNTNALMAAYLPAVRDACPGEAEAAVRWKTHLLVHGVQAAFLRKESIRARMGLDFDQETERNTMIEQIMTLLFPVEQEELNHESV